MTNLNLHSIGKAMLLLMFIFTSNMSFAQKLIQDSRGKDVFENYLGEAVQAEFSPGQTALGVTYSKIIGSPIFYFVGDTAHKTVGKSTSISITGKVEGSGTDDGKSFSISKGLVRPSFRLELGLQRNLNTFYNLRLIPAHKPFTYMYGGHVYGEYQNVNFYDTLAKVQTGKRPFIYGVHVHGTVFHARGFKNLSWAFSLSADLSSNYNSEDFIAYQARSETTYIDPTVVSQGDQLGNIGTYSRTRAYRVRASLPVFINRIVNITPYASVYGYKNGSTNYMPGFAVNFFSGAPMAEKTALAQGFGIAVDWTKTKGAWKTATVSIYGALSLQLIRDAMKFKSE